MGQEVEPGHQQHSVDGQEPMILEHLPDLMEEDARLRPAGLLGIGFSLLVSSSTKENFALWKETPQHCSTSRDAGTSPELVAPGGVSNEV